MSPRDTKDSLYEQVQRIGKALAGAKRLELFDLLSQSEMTVQVLSGKASRIAFRNRIGE